MKTIKLPYKTTEDLTPILKQYSNVMANSRKRKKTTVKHENRRKFQNFISLTNSGQELKKTFRNN